MNYLINELVNISPLGDESCQEQKLLSEWMKETRGQLPLLSPAPVSWFGATGLSHSRRRRIRHMAAGTEERQSVPRTKAWAFNTHPSQEAHLVSASWGGASSLGSHSAWAATGRRQACGTKTVAQASQLLRLVCTSRGNTGKKKNIFFPSPGASRPVGGEESEKTMKSLSKMLVII